MIQATKRRRSKQPQQRTSVRVAIYTRKSVTEGLDQEFNSLDAQRQAIEHYVSSQEAEGWIALPERYDDGGYTGASTNRPAFQKLLADIEAGGIDVIAVYKLDRLSRSIADFTRLMELFQDRGVTFVSVTQQFSTSTPVGRMTLNLLATFAEFEREVIAERTRDKMLAARRKGMWTGGRPVLGYDVVEKKLVVNDPESEQVREIFQLYLDLGSLLSVVGELNRRGWRNKTWTTKAGQLVVGGKFNKGTIQQLLTNPLYVGKVRAGDELHEGQHAAIVGEEVWHAVQAQLRANGRRGGPRRRSDALLAGLLHCGTCGAAMGRHFTSRGGRRYGSYVCQRYMKEGAAACPKSRVPAGLIEALVMERIRTIGRDARLVAQVVAEAKQELEARRPALQAEVGRLEPDRRRLTQERDNLLQAVGERSTPSLVRRLAEVDEAVGELERRRDELRCGLAALNGQALDETDLRDAMARFDPIWDELFPAERARILQLLVERLVYDPAAGEVELTFRPGGVRALARGSA